MTKRSRNIWLSQNWETQRFSKYTFSYTEYVKMLKEIGKAAEKE